MKKKTGPSAVIPLLLNTKEFREAWLMFEQHRKEKRATLTPTAAKLQLKKMEEWGVERAVAAIHYSVEKGWTGIFEPDRNGAPVKKAAPRYDGGW